MMFTWSKKHLKTAEQTQKSEKQNSIRSYFCTDNACVVLVLKFKIQTEKIENINIFTDTSCIFAM